MPPDVNKDHAVPLNREALALEQSPSAATSARRWVAQVCRDLGRSDLVECAELGVSELVTNAILHGEAPIDVRVRGTVAHPRIEVFDASMHPPVRPGSGDSGSMDQSDTADREDLTTYGRGLTMVAMASHAWGAAIEDSGKVVWFEPASALHDAPTDGVIESHTGHEWEPLPDSVTIHLLDLDVALLRSVLTHYSNLRRELRLLALAHDADYPLARDLSPMFATFERQFPPSTLAAMARRMAATHTSHEQTIDLSFDASPRSAHIYRTMLELFELADSFCHSQQLLSLARTPDQRAMQEWLLEEFARQADGLPPRKWDADASSGTVSHRIA